MARGCPDRHRPAEPVTEFHYSRSIGPMLLVMVGLSMVELGVVHLLAALLVGAWLAVPLSLLSIAGIVWLLLAIRSFRRLPVLVGADAVLFRAGTIRSFRVERGDIAAIGGEVGIVELKRADTLSLALLAHPNVVIDLARPVGGPRGRQVVRIAHRLDDPEGFRKAFA